MLSRIKYRVDATLKIPVFFSCSFHSAFMRVSACGRKRKGAVHNFKQRIFCTYRPEGSARMNSLVSPRRTLVVPAIALGLLCMVSGCRKHRGSTSLAVNVQHVVNSPQLAILKWSNYSDYQAQVKQFYDARDWALAWMTKANSRRRPAL